MKITHVLASLDKNCGGTASYLQLLSNQLAQDISIDIFTIKSSESLSLHRKVNLKACESSFPWVQGYSRQLKRNLLQVETSLFHGNGIWQYPVHAMAEIALKRNIPYVLSPHGMLEPWALNAGKFKKNICLSLFQHYDLSHASCIHATAKSEAENIRKLGFKNPIAIIPNGIDLSEFPRFEKKKKQHDKNTLLFLSRIHPKKGIELLIEAWTKLSVSLRKDWVVKIAGNGDVDYIASIDLLIHSYGLENEVFLIGPQFDLDKLTVFKEADLFILPTYSENFGMVVLEAMANCLPVITTNGAPWEELNVFKAGWCVDIGVEPLVIALTEALQLTDLQRTVIGENGRKLVESQYTIENVKTKMIQLYDWILNDSPLPDFIQLD